MFAINNLINDYFTFRKYSREYRIHKAESHDFYMEHRILLDNSLDEYYENYNNTVKIKNLFDKEPILKTYLSLEIIKNHLKEQKNKYSVSSEINNLGKCAIYINKNILVIYDIDNNVNYSYKIDDEGVINYIKTCLQKTDKFIGEISLEEISVLQVIYYDIMHNDIFKNESNKVICKHINNELNKARMFDNFYIDRDQNKNLPVNINEEFAKLIELYKNKQITTEEYYIRYYYFLILSNQDVEKLYNKADIIHKEYIMKAYLELSSYNSKVHVRTTSKIINKAVLERVKKTDTK